MVTFYIMSVMKLKVLHYNEVTHKNKNKIKPTEHEGAPQNIGLLHIWALKSSCS